MAGYGNWPLPSGFAFRRLGRHPALRQIQFGDLDNTEAVIWSDWFFDAPAGTIYSYAPSGGVQVGGVAAVTRVMVPAVDGGVQTGGAVAVTRVRVPAVDGGVQAGGEAAVTRVRVPAIDGGVQTGGHAETVFVSGEEQPAQRGWFPFVQRRPPAKIYQFEPSGGVTASGSAQTVFVDVRRNVYEFKPSGGVHVSGAAETSLHDQIAHLMVMDDEEFFLLFKVA